MKLTFFTDQTVPKQLSRHSTKLPRISFTKAGVLVLNQTAMQKLNLKAGDKISLAQDPDNPSNWYIFKDKENGFEIRHGYKQKAGLINHRQLCDLFLDCFGMEKDKSNSFKLGGQPTIWGKVEYWGILVNVPVENED
jgi:hypothetical protein